MTAPPVTFLGQPRGLFIMLWAEIGERFSFYGMRALLVLYLIDRFGMSDEGSVTLYGNFVAIIFATPIVGGWLADNVFGLHRSTIIGAILMIIGYTGLAVEQWLAPGNQLTLLFGALASVSVGTGLCKPSMSSIVGNLYSSNAATREAGFTLFYLGVGLGSAAASVACGYVGQSWGWNAGFGLACLGLVVGLIGFIMGRRLLPHSALPQTAVDTGAKRLFVTVGLVGAIPLIGLMMTNTMVTGVLLIILSVAGIVYVATRIDLRSAQGAYVARVGLTIFVVSVAFWIMFELTATVMPLFIQRMVELEMPWGTAKASQFVSLIFFFLLLFGPFSGALWGHLEKKGRNPRPQQKFAIGFAACSMCFGLLAWRCAGDAALVGAWWIVAAYALLVIGDLCIVPIGLSLTTHIAPQGLKAMFVAVWYIAVSVGSYASSALVRWAGLPDGSTPVRDALPHYSSFFLAIALFAIAMAAFAVLPGNRRKLENFKFEHA
jgi:POT family proton-dependent oligopeptide transporter